MLFTQFWEGAVYAHCHSRGRRISGGLLALCLLGGTALICNDRAASRADDQPSADKKAPEKTADAAKPPAAKPGLALRTEIEVQGAWGNAPPDNVHAVLRSAAHQVLQFCGDRTLNKIQVSFAEGPPITLYRKGPKGEYLIHLSSKDTYWAQYSYQFAHELGHVLANYDRRKQRTPHHWFEECLCDTSSLFVLRRLQTAWAENPPYANWRDFAPAFKRYSDDLLADPSRKLPPGKDLPQWLRENLKTLSEQGGLSPLSQLVSGQLLPIFEADPQGWESLTWINLGDNDHACDFPTFLRGWRERCPEKHRPFVNKLLAAFGYPTA